MKPLTDEKPKCMLEFKGRPIIDYILGTITACGTENIAIVDGYKRKVLEEYLKGKDLIFYTNERFDKTNMVYTLFCAEDELTDDIIISYGDIIYEKAILEELISSPYNFAITVDVNWRQLWERRMGDPLNDIETLKLDQEGYIIELGKKPVSYDDIQGQYMGLIKIKNNLLPKVIQFYHQLDRSEIYDGKDFNNMFMTSFLQKCLENIAPLKAIMVKGKWLEIDFIDDLNVQIDID